MNKSTKFLIGQKYIHVVAFLFFIFSGLSFKGTAQQIIGINPPGDPNSTHSLEYLIKNILITGSCSNVSNFHAVVYGDSTQSGTKSYGYFKRPAGSNFPFEEGVVITTGRAYEGGNITTSALVSTDLSGSTGSDADIEQALGLSPGTTYDATYIEFDFVPYTDTIQFRFLIASEEYDGTFECSYSDGFAFLLREASSSTYTNIAVLPNGVPVSVTNITASPNCPNNTQYFAGYGLPDTNYDGRTVPLVARAVVVPNTTYHIKLVIADHADAIYDSAIFLEGGSFHLGVNLGDDLTIAGGNAVCGDSQLLQTVNFSGASYQWFFNGNPIPGANSYQYLAQSVNSGGLGSGTYTVEVSYSAGCTGSDDIIVEFVELPASVQPVSPPLEICDNDFDGIVDFDLTVHTPAILNGASPNDFEVIYYASETDMLNGTNPITHISNSTPNTPQTVYAVVRNIAAPYCFITTEFEIVVGTPPEVFPVSDLEVCDDDFDGISTFNLHNAEADILNGRSPAQYEITFYETQNDALNQTNPIANPSAYTNTNPNTQTVYYTIVDMSASCINMGQFDIVVLEKPSINMESNYIVCRGDSIFVEAPAGFVSYQWNTGAATRGIYISSGGTYSVTVVNDAGCSNAKEIDVYQSEPAVIDDVIVNDFQGDDNSIEILVSGPGEYEFSLDGLNFGDSNIFTGLSPGTYTVFVNDRLGCGTVEQTVYVLGALPYFSPNGDGINDYWQIINIDRRPGSVIRIFDRYGKLLDVFGHDAPGWDGYNAGSPLPADDYWFVAEIKMPDQSVRVVRGHFSLIR